MALKKCKECGTEVSTKGVCPNCGKDQRNFFVKHKAITFILIVIVIGAIVGVGGGNKTTNNSIKTDSPTTSTEQEKFTLQDGHTGKADTYGISYTIEGTIKNNTDKQYSYVQVKFNLYDNEGAQLGTALDSISNLEANGMWKFKASGSFGNGKTVASYKLIEITGW